MKFWYVMVGIILFSIGFFYPIYNEIGNDMFVLKTEAGEWNYFYLIYLFYFIFNILLNIKFVKNKGNEIWFLFINMFLMILYCLYMVWEAQGDAYIIAITFSYLLIIVIQVGMLILRNIIKLIKEERTMENIE